MRVVQLHKGIDRRQFLCENDTLTEYFHTLAGQDMRRRVSVCYVALNKSNEVVGYYTLSTHSLGREAIPEEHRKKVPKGYEAPVILLGRLARHSNHSGTGLGGLILLDALFRSYELSEQTIGAMAVVTDPINERARAFYLKYGFIDILDSERMMISMKSIEALKPYLDNAITK